MGEGSGGVTEGVWMEWCWEKGGLSGWVAVGMRWDQVGEAVATWGGVASLRRSGTVGVGWDGREGFSEVFLSMSAWILAWILCGFLWDFCGIFV